MADAFENWASGNWHVKSGNEDEFVQRWKAWLEWSSQNIPGFVSATLVRDLQNPNHFVSFSAWQDAASRDAWKSSAGFAEQFPAVRELCDSFEGGDHELVASF
jgi:heme-degrading monooxygenase HmoA